MRYEGYPKPVKVENYEDMAYDITGTAYYWDHELGIVFKKFQVDLPRTSESRVACIPDGKHCPSFEIVTLDGAFGSTDCTNRVYPKYQNVPIKSQ